MNTPLIVVPARWGSTRLPGKPLVPIAGRTLLERVLRVAERSAEIAGGCAILVATDDERIVAHANALGHRAVMTSPSIASGSDRALAAARTMSSPPDIVLNLQGDAPFTPPAAVAQLIAAIRHGATVATASGALSWIDLDALRAHKLRSPFSGTTCIRGLDGNALWFSKHIIPQLRNEDVLREASPMSPILRHLGIYCYTLEALGRFSAAPPSYHEQLEQLEQLRFFDLGIDIRVELVTFSQTALSGIDTKEDVHLAEAMISQYGDA